MSYKEELLKNDRIRVQGGKDVDIRFHDGGLRHAVGVKNYQIMRACRNAEWSGDGYGWTYNHAAMIAWWNKKFFVEYLSNVKTEHMPPGQTLMCHSEDGRHWSKPEMVFPSIEVPTAPYTGPGKEQLGETTPAICHQRMGFYVTKSGKLLVSAFYGISPNIHIAPNNGYGVGRVVREVYPDLSLSPIYFIRYNAPGGYVRENTDVFPYFEESQDAEFVEACREYLNNRLVVQQWWEEQRFDKELFTAPGGQALSYYTLPDGDIMGVYKKGMVIRSHDGGETWTDSKPSYSLETNTAKVWGQKTEDGKYALVYNPSRNGAHRWPLAVVTGENGEDFGDMLAIVPEISPCRYEGGLKNLGAQYMRGICESNPRPEDHKMWLTYSINKEDIWVTEVPVPICGTVSEDAADDFAKGTTDEQWGLYIPQWCGAEVKDGALVLSDADPYDRPRAERAVVPAALLEVETRVKVGKLRQGTALVIEAEDRSGKEAIRLMFDADGWLRVKTGGAPRECIEYPAEEWIDIRMTLDSVKGTVDIALSSETLNAQKEFNYNQPLEQVERVIFTTKAKLPWQTIEDCGKGEMLEDLPNDVPAEKVQVYIQKFASKTLAVE
nr:hypothetical protein [uncultured Blautia sp.]